MALRSSTAASPAIPFAGLPVFRATSLTPPASRGSWRFDSLAGILTEISEETPAGAVSFAAEIIMEAQGRGEPAAWVCGTESIFFPPDFAKRGVDLSSLAVVRAGADVESLTAAEWLVRSGAMGLVVVDAEGHGNVPDAFLGRILKVAEKNLCAVVFLTRKRRLDPSLGSRISLRGCVSRSGSGPFRVDIHTLKDKRSNSASRQSRQYHGPSGMY
jgi:recombination protein RecA